METVGSILRNNPPPVNGRSVSQFMTTRALPMDAFAHGGTPTEVSGTFDPTKNDYTGRYGILINSVKGWPGRNVVGPRATGDNVNLMDDGGTVFLAAKILGVEPGRWDLIDVMFLEGAAAYLLELGRQRGVIPPAAIQIPPLPPPLQPFLPPALGSPQTAPAPQPSQPIPPTVPVAPSPSPAPVAPTPAPTSDTSGSTHSGTVAITDARPLVEEVVTFSRELTMRGEIVPAGDQVPDTAYRIFGLGLQSKHGGLPRNWQLWELKARNGHLKLEVDGRGGGKVKKPPLVPAVDLGLVARPGVPIPFDLVYDGEEVEIAIGGRHFKSPTFRQAADGVSVFLYYGAPQGLDIKPPIGWVISRNVAVG